MPLVKFTATADLKTWEHKRGGRRQGTYGDKPTTKLVEAEVLRHGDQVEMETGEAAWATTHYPRNFSIVATAPAPAKLALDEEGEDEADL